MKKLLLGALLLLSMFGFSQEKAFARKYNYSVLEKETTFNKIQKLSESKSQEAASAKVLSKYPTAKLIGKTVGKDIVFEVEDKRLKVSTKGGFKLL